MIKDKAEMELDRRKSADDGAPGMKLDALNKGNCSDIKNMFEENIAVKKGLIPDPNVQKATVVKMRRKVNPNLPNVFKKNEEEERRKNRESVPIDRKMFNHFLNKFEDDNSRQAAKAQLWRLTKKQKDYLSKDSNTPWSKKQEEKKMLEEKRILEEIEAQEAAEARIKAEEEERLRRLQREKEEEEERERQRKLQEEEEQRKAREAEEKKKKGKKKPKKKTTESESKELPNLVANTCSDLKKKFQESLKATNEVNKAPPLEKPKARKRIENPFEKQTTTTDVASVKRREMPIGRENRLG